MTKIDKAIAIKRTIPFIAYGTITKVMANPGINTYTM